MKVNRPRRKTKAVVIFFVVVLVVGFSVRNWPLFLAQAQATSTSAPSNSRMSGFYLDVGASASLGFQPTGRPHGNGSVTDTGYANDVVSIEAAKDVTLTLHQIGCPGETAESMLVNVDKCYKPPVGQRSLALHFLRENHYSTGLVTIDLGFNDVRVCLVPTKVIESCVTNGIALVRRDLPTVVRQLKAAAGPRVRFVGILYDDPFLAHYLHGSSGQTDAAATLAAMTTLNATLASIYTSQRITIADVPQAFQSDNQNPSPLPHVGPVPPPQLGRVPRDVANVCKWTWMCQGTPFGPDDHPNNTGYEVIAKVIAATLPRTW